MLWADDAAAALNIFQVFSQNNGMTSIKMLFIFHTRFAHTCGKNEIQFFIHIYVVKKIVIWFLEVPFVLPLRKLFENSSLRRCCAGFLGELVPDVFKKSGAFFRCDERSNRLVSPKLL